ncbi:MAG: hypothetical protein ACE14W_00035 [Candidatus Velamenicoccus archaeovorus]
MFHVMWNRPISETDLLVRLLRALRASLPAGWAVEEELEPTLTTTAGSRWRPDALLRVQSPDGKQATVIVEAKSQLEPRDVRSALDQVTRYASAIDADGTLVAAPYLGPRAREVIAEAAPATPMRPATGA